jgi:hypothetical protein
LLYRVLKTGASAPVFVCAPLDPDLKRGRQRARSPVTVSPWNGSVAFWFLFRCCFCSGTRARNFLAVDTRLDSGGAFDYGSANCRYDVQHLPDTSYAESFCRLIAANAVLFIGVVLALRRARNNG